jgi:formylglycine-generating enzyme required for sulfatase activity
LNWYTAAYYCNWLSEHEGLPKEQWCYEPNKQGKYAAGMRAKNKFWQLKGYRLPTEAEWEFACRAGTVTSRYYGLTDQLLSQYAWYAPKGANQTWPVGQLEPNDFGLFDMYGNVIEMCFDVLGRYPMQKGKVFEDTPSTQPVEDAINRALRGGAFSSPASRLRSADRDSIPPSQEDVAIGFRPARTYP